MLVMCKPCERTVHTQATLYYGMSTYHPSNDCFSTVLDDGLFYMLKWGVTLPLCVLLYYTVPDCRQKRLVY